MGSYLSDADARLFPAHHHASRQARQPGHDFDERDSCCLSADGRSLDKRAKGGCEGERYVARVVGATQIWYLMARERRRVLVPFVALFAAFLIFTLFLVNSLMLIAIHQNRRWINQTREVQQVVTDAYFALVDAEASQRGFLRTGNVAYLGAFESSERGLPGMTAEMARLTENDPTQQRSVATLEPLVAATIKEIRRTVDLYRRGSTAAALSRADESRRSMDDARRILGDMRLRADELLDQRTAETRRNLDLAIWVDAFAGGALLVLGFMLFATYRDLKRREELESALMEGAAFQEQFVGILGHDLRNPLSAVSMAAHLLQVKGNLNEKQAHSVQMISSTASRMNRMVDQLLDLTRARVGGGIPIEPRPGTDLSEVARVVIEELCLARAGADVRLDAEPEVRGAWDPDRLAQVVSNLVANALIHGIGPVDVRVRGADGVATLEVHNGGPPIPADLLPSVFDAFRRRFLKERTAQGPGLGLGLFISRQIVAQHGGQIEVRSSVSGGTTFAVRLPMALPEAVGKNDLIGTRAVGGSAWRRRVPHEGASPPR
jgi:signal transduction histidine kinase